jgi:LacI family transcriptional regulator
MNYRKLIRAKVLLQGGTAPNDVLAMGAVRAIHDAGLGVPDDILSSSYLNPRLTTVKFSITEMGRQAAQIMLELVQKQRDLPPQTITLPVELLVRDSTAPSKKSS